ncbi:hypothetical protein K456DRAFT_142164 [Colletotrichum gloeosporioides 23]|nr:hypothetical protein K456DRAFT_142164 [Colletotrichum gloeosporioides 23]
MKEGCLSRGLSGYILIRGEAITIFGRSCTLRYSILTKSSRFYGVSRRFDHVRRCWGGSRGRFTPHRGRSFSVCDWLAVFHSLALQHLLRRSSSFCSFGEISVGVLQRRIRRSDLPLRSAQWRT